MMIQRPREFVEWRSHLAQFKPDLLACLEHLSSLSYRQRCAYLKRDKLPHFLYKFRSCRSPDGSDTWIDRLRDLLVRSHLWLSCPVSFNDPFDNSGKFTLCDDPSELRTALDSMAKEQGVEPEQREKWIEHRMSHPEILLAEGQKQLEQMRTTTGVYSFAGNSRSILMWSHYADHHSGLCFQFDVAQDVVNLTAAMKVEYRIAYPILDYCQMHRDEKIVNRVIGRKSKGWTYEDEHRIIIPNGAGNYFRFDPAALTGVIIGCRASPARDEGLKRLLAERSAKGLPSLKKYRAFQHASEYRLTLKKE